MTMMTNAGAVPSFGLEWRLKLALDYAGMTVQEMADYLEVSRQTMSRWLSGKGPIKRHILLSWALRTGVSMVWLETGEAPSPDDGGGGQMYGIRDSNPEPADMEDSLLACGVAA